MENTTLHGDTLLNETAAAEVCGGLSVKTLQAWRVSGRGPRFIKMGTGSRSAVRYRRSELLRWLDACERGSTAEHSAQIEGA